MTTFRNWTGRLSPIIALTALLLAPVGPAAAQNTPYTGIIVEDNVQVRAGAGRAYYVVGELDRGKLVEVEEVIFGWLKIVPPDGVNSYISKAFVDASGEGRTGTVNANRTRVTAASIEGPGNSYREQTLLNRGATVKIAGEEGSFYKIAPPANTYVFLPPGSVRREADMEAARQPVEDDEDTAAESTPRRPEPEDDPEPATDPAVAPSDDADTDSEAEPTTRDQTSDDADDVEPAETDREADAEAKDAAADVVDEPAAAGAEEEVQTQEPGEAETATTEQPVEDEAEDAVEVAEAPAEEAEQVETPAISDALREVEQRHLPAFNLPLEEQPFDRMIADYQAVRESEGDALPQVDRRIIAHRLATMERNQRLASTLVRLAELREQSEQTDRELEQRQQERDARRPDYDAVGELLASTVYDGRSLPRLYRLVDPTTGRTIGYVEPSDEIQPRHMLGRVVGIVGDRQLDPGLRLRVFNLRRIDVLETTSRE
ncbi:MAG: hypothetical protein WD534_07160 [Phycisphaeraceae bacterium]